MLDALMPVWLLLSGAFGEAQQEYRVGTQCGLKLRWGFSQPETRSRTACETVLDRFLAASGNSLAVFTTASGRCLRVRGISRTE